MPSTVTVKKVDLLETLKENRDAHREVFEQALAGWQKRVVEELEKAVADAKAGRQYRTYFSLPQPQDHTADYDRVIGMVEWEMADEITLAQAEFVQFVQDDWGWQRDFLRTSAAYSASAATLSTARYGDDNQDF